MDYRFPVFEADVTLLNGEVTGVRFEPLLGVQLASIHITMSNQSGTVIARGDADVELCRILKASPVKTW